MAVSQWWLCCAEQLSGGQLVSLCALPHVLLSQVHSLLPHMPPHMPLRKASTKGGFNHATVLPEVCIYLIVKENETAGFSVFGLS